MEMIKVKNTSNGVKSEFTKEQWENVKNSDRWAGVFEEVKPATPKEIKNLEQKEAETAQKSTQNTNATASTNKDAKAAQNQKNQ